MKLISRNKTALLCYAALASTLFCIYSSTAAAALTNLDAGANGQTSANATYPPGTGYNYSVPNVSFTILDAVPIGNTGGVAVDNNNGLPGVPNASTVLNFAGGSIVAGTVGPTNAIGTINLAGGAGKTVDFTGNVTVGNLNFVAGSTATSTAKFEDNVVINGNIDNTSGGAGIGSLNVVKTAIIIGSIGSTNSLNLASVNSGAAGVGVLTLQGPLINIGTINLAGGAANATTLDLNNLAMALTGNITTSANNSGVLNFQGASTTVTGNIGTNALALHQVQITGNATVNGNIFATNVEFQAASTLTLGNNSTLSGTLTTLVPNQGTLTLSGNFSGSNTMGAAGTILNTINVSGAAGTTVNFNNQDISAFNINVNNGGTLSVIGAQTINNANLALTNASVLNIANGAALNLLNGGLLALNAGTTLQVDMASTLTAGTVTSTGISVVNADAILNVLNPGTGTVGTTTTIPIIISNGGGGSLNAIAVHSNGGSLITQYSTKVSGNNLNLIVETIPLTNFVSSNQVLGLANTLDIIAETAPGPSGALLGIINQLPHFTDVESLNEALQNLAPLVDGGILNASFSTQQVSINDVDARMEQRRFVKRVNFASEPISSYVAGDPSNYNNAIWVKGFGQHARQWKREEIEGYRSDMTGVAIGGDRWFSDCVLLGFSANYAHVGVDHRLNGSDTKIESYQATLYGSYQFASPLYFDAIASIAHNDYETHRYVVFGNVLLTPEGDYDGSQYALKGELGYELSHPNNAWHSIPFISLYYSHLDLDGYTETGAGTANQSVQSADFDMLQAAVGFKFFYNWLYGCDIFRPNLHIGLAYDFIDDRMDITSQFTGGGPSFRTEGMRPAQLSFNGGVGFTYLAPMGLTFSAIYDLNAKDRYTAHSYLFKIRYEW